MNNIQNSYTSYEGLLVSTTAVSKKDDKKTAQLSDAASEYLQKLRTQYNNVDFIVADFSTDKEAQQLLSQGKGEYNCVITPDLLEKMAADEDERVKFEGIIESAIGDLSAVKEQLGEEDAQKVESFGVSVDSDGNVSYYALLKEGLKKDERVEKAREKAAEKKAEAKEKQEEEQYEKRLVKASTVEELIALIKGDKKEESKDRIEFGNDDDDALKIDRLDFGNKKSEEIFEDFIPASAAYEVKPFDFKA